MNKANIAKKLFYPLAVAILIFMLSASACSQVEQVIFLETVENYPQAEVVFQVTLPSPLPVDEKLNLEIIDEITGIYFNPSHYEMAKQDDLNFFIRLPLTLDSRVKYRYFRKGIQTNYEHTTRSEEVRYRVLQVNGPTFLQDFVAAWANQPYLGAAGKLRGQLIDHSNQAPIPNMVVYAGGMQTITASDGSFILEGLPVWTQNVVIASLDGVFETFQQGAVIAEDATTPILLELTRRPMVDVEFLVKMPEGFSTTLPLRFASNLTSLGYPEFDLPSGSKTISSNLPVFTQNNSSEYSLRLKLPAGADLKYKFTLGDGFWNSELQSNGNFIIRSLIVPTTGVAVRKKVSTFRSPGSGEININLTTPSTTPAEEFVSLQLNPFGWMQPLPMQKTGENTWAYSLYSPLHLLGEIEYRFCRNDQCLVAPAAMESPLYFNKTENAQSININVTAWQNLTASTGSTNVETNGGSLSPRTDFITGFELATEFPASWQYTLENGLKAAYGFGANWAIISPTWTATKQNPPMFEPIAGRDLLWPDLQNILTRVSQANLQPVLFPRMRFTETSDTFWLGADRDAGWWQSYFERYQRFLLQNADLANVMNAQALIVGDPAMMPSTTNGHLADGVSSNAPQNSDEQWTQLIQDVRARYSGPIIGVLSLPNSSSTLPGWVKDVDALYILFNPDLSDSDGSILTLRASFSTKIEDLVAPVAAQYSKPVIIGVDFASADASRFGCIANNDSCLPISQNKAEIDLDLQARMYNAAIIESAARPWIIGFISREYYPFVVNKDAGPSVYGKPASDVLWFWNHFITNRSPQ